MCLNIHVLNAVPDGQCVTTDIDTRAATTAKTYAVPTASRTVNRPAAGGSGYATHQIDVTYLSGTTWTAYASSWPASNLAGASLPLFAIGASVGPLPEQQGVVLESRINARARRGKHLPAGLDVHLKPVGGGHAAG